MHARHVARRGARVGRRGRAAVACAQCGGVRQRVGRCERIAFEQMRIVARGDPRQRIERQPVAHRRIAGHQIHPLVAEEPRPRLPARAVERGRAVRAPDRQHVADHAVEPPVEHVAQPRAFQFVVDARIERIDVHGQPAFAPQVVPDVFVAGPDEVAAQAETCGERVDEALRVVGAQRGRLALVREQRRIVPHRLAVRAPEDRHRPARQLFARIPLALPDVQKATAPVFGAQPLHELGRVAALGRAERVGVPFGAVAVVDRHEGRLAALREPHVAGPERAVDLRAERAHRIPLRIVVRLRHAR